MRANFGWIENVSSRAKAIAKITLMIWLLINSLCTWYIFGNIASYISDGNIDKFLPGLDSFERQRNLRTFFITNAVQGIGVFVLVLSITLFALIIFINMAQNKYFYLLKYNILPKTLH